MIQGYLRSTILSGWAAYLLLLSSCDSPSEEARPTVDHPRFVGTAPGSDRDFETLLPYFSQLTPENAAKWGSVEKDRDEMNWKGLDEAYEFARDNDLVFKFHALVWGLQQPPWLKSLPQDEQLAELKEWMSLVAERYPDLELIDVVNEPLHETPSYAEALGGRGKTGFDWVIQSFKLARSYFPKSSLILNDYSILIHKSFTDDYLQLVERLQERKLVDAIGLQAHNLEKSEPSAIAANLKTLAGTGLPIYISEFDLKIKDDALHARVFRDLFTTFWDSSSVAGVTFWGHLEGHTWRPNTYFLRADESLRPAMEWLGCLLDEKDDCEIPKYKAPTRKGSVTGITLQAEDFDATHGVIALGSRATYTDDGDWISYSSVEFQEAWEQLTVTYQNGNKTTGSISFHLGSLDAKAALTLPIPPTGGWTQTDSVTVPWPEFDGKEDLFIRFLDADSVGNFFNFRFGDPPPEPDGSNLVTGGDFEVDATGWTSWGGGVEISFDHVHEGVQSLKSADRTDWSAVAYDLSSLVAPGQSYNFSLAVDISGEASEEVEIMKKQSCAGEEELYEALVDATSITPGEWEVIEGTFQVADCKITEFLFFISGPPAGVDIFLDNVSVE